MSYFDLKGYISRDFRDFKHKRKSLIEIFLEDNAYYNYLLDNHPIDSRAAYFFSKYAKEVRETESWNSGFRNLKCYQLVDEFLKGASTDHSSVKSVSNTDTKKNKDNNKRPVNNQQKNLKVLCPVHKLTLRLEKTITTKENGKRYTVPVLKCSLCMRLYTYVPFRKYKSLVKIGKKSYTNLYPDNPLHAKPETDNRGHQKRPEKSVSNSSNVEDLTESAHNSCFVFSNNAPARCINSPCNNLLTDRRVLLYNAEHIKKKFDIKSCKHCGVFYLHQSIQEANSDFFEIIGNVPELIEPKGRVSPSSGKPSHFEKKGSNTETPAPNINPAPKLKIKKEITAQDFVIWKNSFHCYNKGHEVQEIDALITVMNRNGNLIQCEIAASYCKQCEKYFILEGTYKELLRLGTIACRVTDEETYLQELRRDPPNGGFSLAPESILHQCGYSVSQSSALSAKQRLEILKLIIDNNICSKDRVLSHLDYLISWFGKQRGHKNDLAISKWKSDRDSISQYRVGSNRKVVVKVIKIRK